MDFRIKRGDLNPTLATLLKEGQPVDLTGKTMQFRFKSRAGGIVQTAPVSIIEAGAGKVQISWQSGQTDITGYYIGEFVDSSGNIYPSEEFVEFEIITSIS